MLTSTYKQMNARLQALRFNSNRNEENWKSAMNDHAQMIDALEARDPAAMRRVLISHLNNKCDVVVAQLHANIQTIYSNAKT